MATTERHPETLARHRRASFPSPQAEAIFMLPNEIQVQVAHDHIIVTMPGTLFKTTFLKADGSGLVQSHVVSVDHTALVSTRDFERAAWEAAQAKARELGWID
jgi:hypothetical protein